MSNQLVCVCMFVMLELNYNGSTTYLMYSCTICLLTLYCVDNAVKYCIAMASIQIYKYTVCVYFIGACD